MALPSCTSEEVADARGAPVTANSLAPVPDSVVVPETAREPRVPTPVMLPKEPAVRSELTMPEVERTPEPLVWTTPVEERPERVTVPEEGIPARPAIEPEAAMLPVEAMLKTPPAPPPLAVTLR